MLWGTILTIILDLVEKQFHSSNLSSINVSTCTEPVSVERSTRQALGTNETNPSFLHYLWLILWRMHDIISFNKAWPMNWISHGSESELSLCSVKSRPLKRLPEVLESIGLELYANLNIQRKYVRRFPAQVNLSSHAPGSMQNTLKQHSGAIKKVMTHLYLTLSRAMIRSSLKEITGCPFQKAKR